MSNDPTTPATQTPPDSASRETGFEAHGSVSS